MAYGRCKRNWKTGLKKFQSATINGWQRWMPDLR